MLSNYKNRSQGPLGTCKPCDCSGNEDSCRKRDDGSVVCVCMAGFSGSRCEVAGGVVSPDDRVMMTIEGPKIQIRQVGANVEFKCNVNQLASVSGTLLQLEVFQKGILLTLIHLL